MIENSKISVIVIDEKLIVKESKSRSEIFFSIIFLLVGYIIYYNYLHHFGFVVFIIVILLFSMLYPVTVFNKSKHIIYKRYYLFNIPLLYVFYIGNAYNFEIVSEESIYEDDELIYYVRVKHIGNNYNVYSCDSRRITEKLAEEIRSYYAN